jgi:hypothetical protein
MASLKSEVEFLYFAGRAFIALHGSYRPSVWSVAIRQLGHRQRTSDADCAEDDNW